MGGSCRIPLVQEELERIFGKKPNKSLNFDTAISTGATIQGGVLSGDNTDIAMQNYVCTLVGYKAKSTGKHKEWWRTQTLYWRGQAIDRHSEEYQYLLDRAYDALASNEGFRAALLATGDAVLKHSIGKHSKSQTVLTEQEFCSRLMRIRGEVRDS